MKLLRSALLLSATLTLPVFAVSDYLELLPKNPAAVFVITDSTILQEKYEASPMAEAFAESTLVETFKKMLLEGAEENGNVTADQLQDLSEHFSAIMENFQGASCFVVGDLQPGFVLMQTNKSKRDQLLEQMDEGGELPVHARQEQANLDKEEMDAILGEFLFMADLSSDPADLYEDIDAFLDYGNEQDDEGQAVMEETEIAGVRAYRMSYSRDESDDEVEVEEATPDLLWAVVEDTMVLGFSENGVEAQIGRLLGKTRGTFASNLLLQDALETTDRGDILFFLNLPAVHEWIKPFTQGLPNQPGQPSAGDVLDFFGLNSMRPIVASISLVEDGILSKSHLGFVRSSVLSDMFIQEYDEPAPKPDFIHTDVLAVSAGHWELGRFYDQLEKNLVKLTPQAGMVLGMGRGMIGAQLGLDFKTQFLDQLGSEVVIAQEFDEEAFEKILSMTAETGVEPGPMQDGQSYLFAFGVKDRAAVESAINTMMAKAHPQGAPEPFEYKGHKLYQPLEGLMPQDGNALAEKFTYAWIDDYLVIGAGSLDIMRHAVDAEEDESLRLWNSEIVAARSEDFGFDGDGLSYTDVSATMGMMVSSMDFLFEMMQKETKSGAANQMDFAFLEDIFSVSMEKMKLDGLTITSESMMFYNTEND